MSLGEDPAALLIEEGIVKFCLNTVSGVLTFTGSIPASGGRMSVLVLNRRQALRPGALAATFRLPRRRRRSWPHPIRRRCGSGFPS